MVVHKRDGNTEDFDASKLLRAIKKANAKSPEKEEEAKLEKVATSATSFIKSLKKDIIDVEEIHKAIENALMKNNCFEVARQYMNYRRERDLKRFKKLPIVGVMESKLFVKKSEGGEHQNANLDEFSFGGKKGEMDSAFLKEHALNYYISPKFAKNHLQNRVYIHDLDSYILGMHNCFVRSTKFVTSEGIRSFSDFNDGDAVDVLCKDGSFRQATVKYFGDQSMYDVTFVRGRLNIRKTVTCTNNHRWILKDGSVTTNLSVGDRLFPLQSSVITEKDIKDKRDAEMFSFGFILGDGRDKSNKYLTVRLCGAKMQYAYIFEKAGYHHYCVCENGDKCFIKKSAILKQDFLSNKMWNCLSLRDKQMLFAGYYAADGSRSHGYGVCTADSRLYEMSKDISCLAGYHIYSDKEEYRDTNFKVNAHFYCLSFTAKHSVNTLWTVESIRKHKGNTKYQAWCIVEPETHSFTLENGMVTGNCLSVPMDELLSSDVYTRQTIIRPAGSINTAMQLIAVYFQLQSLQQFGGVAATHVDWTLVPYVRKSFMKHYIVAYLKSTDEFEELDLPALMFKDYKDDNGVWHNELEDWIDFKKDDYLKRLGLVKEDFTFDNKKLDKTLRQQAIFDTIQETKQAAEGMIHNLNSLQSRSGNQLPFSSINYGTCTLEEGRIVTRAILSATIKGTGNGQTSIFPCQIFQKMKGVNDKGSPNYDLYKYAIRCTAKRMYPNYVNCDWSQDQGYNKDDPRTFPSTMGCRTYSGWDINAPDEAHSHMKDGRGNIAPATVILPTIAMEAKRKAEKDEALDYVVDYFMEALEKAIGDCKDELIERFEWICSQDPASADFMYHNHTFFSYGDEFEKEGIRGALKHGTLAIGQIGLAETLQILIGCDQTTEKGMELAKRIESLFQKKCKEYKENYKLNFGVYYTPAENLCFTSYTKFVKKYGLIENVTAYKDENGKLVPRGYFTNSIHVPVWTKVDPFEKIDIESQLTGYSSAGCITYVEIGDKAEYNLEALEQIVDYAMEKDVPYFALNVLFSDCTKCGYSGYIADDEPCPCCDADHETYINDYARITGYLAMKTAFFNGGKKLEKKDRYVNVNRLSTWKTA